MSLTIGSTVIPFVAPGIDPASPNTAVMETLFDGVTAGTASASKALVLDSNKAVAGLGALTGASLAATGAVTSSGTAGVGYATGAGGAVTQLTSRTTAVTLNKIAGAITLFSAAGSATPATFTVNNTTIGANDVVLISQASGTNLYETFVTAISAATSFNVTFFTTGGTATDAPVFNFVIIKGVAA